MAHEEGAAGSSLPSSGMQHPNGPPVFPPNGYPSFTAPIYYYPMQHVHSSQANDDVSSTIPYGYMYGQQPMAPPFHMGNNVRPQQEAAGLQPQFRPGSGRQQPPPQQHQQYIWQERSMLPGGAGMMYRQPFAWDHTGQIPPPPGWPNIPPQMTPQEMMAAAQWNGMQTSGGPPMMNPPNQRGMQQQPPPQQQYWGDTKQDMRNSMYSDPNNGHMSTSQQSANGEFGGTWDEFMYQQAAPQIGVWENPKGGGGGGSGSGSSKQHHHAHHHQPNHQPPVINQWTPPTSEPPPQKWQQQSSSNAPPPMSSYDAPIGPWIQEQSAAPTSDMMWRDPNPKAKKTNLDNGTSVWGDPSAQKDSTINRWQKADGPPAELDYNALLAAAQQEHPVRAPVTAMNMGWHDPIPSDRVPHSNHELTQSILRMAVDKGLFSSDIFNRQLPPHSLIELNELLRQMSRLDQLNVEKGKTPQVLADPDNFIDREIASTKNDLERLRNIINGDGAFPVSGSSKLQQWKRSAESSSVDALDDSMRKLGLESMVPRGLGTEDNINILNENLDEPPEFIPGKQWQWRNDPTKIAEDPTITPGQCKPSPLLNLAATIGNGNGTEGQQYYEPWSNGDMQNIVGPSNSEQTPFVWIGFPHNQKAPSSVIYQACMAAGPVLQFIMNDQYAYAKFSESRAANASMIIETKLPMLAGQVKYFTDDQIKDYASSEAQTRNWSSDSFRARP